MPGAQEICSLLYTHATIFFSPNDVPARPRYGTIGMEHLVVQLQRHASRCWWPVVSASRIVQIDGLVQFPPSGRHLPRARRLIGLGEAKGDEKGLLQRTYGRTPEIVRPVRRQIPLTCNARVLPNQSTVTSSRLCFSTVRRRHRETSRSASGKVSPHRRSQARATDERMQGQDKSAALSHWL